MPSEASNYGFRGDCYVGMEKFDEAIADYREAIKKDPRKTRNHETQLARALIKSGAVEQALAG